MLYFKNDKLIFDKGRCCQCGTCLASCPDGALKTILQADGLSLIEWDANLCIRCEICFTVCPARKLPDNPLTDQNWANLKGAFLVFPRDNEQRFRGSSGGVARTLLASLVNRGLVDCAYGLRKSSRYPWAEGRFWNPPVQSSQIPGSMYLPIMANKNLKLRTATRTLLVIGLPCQLLGAEELLKNQVQCIYKVAILCKQQKTLGFLYFIAKRLGISFNPESDMEISFRGAGWPGNFTIGSKTMPFEQAARLPFSKRLWRVPGCLFCPNPSGGNADLTLADPWGIEKPGTLGKTLTLAWTKEGQDLLEQNKELIEIEPIDVIYAKKSLDWSGMQRKQRLMDYYLGREVSFRVMLGGIGERIQTKLYETFLNRFRLPELGYKILTHLPDLGGIAK